MKVELFCWKIELFGITKTGGEPATIRTIALEDSRESYALEYAYNELLQNKDIVGFRLWKLTNQMFS